MSVHAWAPGQCLESGHLAPRLAMTTIPSLPQQTSEPSYPDIVLIAINRHGVLLIHPKTKVQQQGWGLEVGTPAIISSTMSLLPLDHTPLSQ